MMTQPKGRSNPSIHQWVNKMWYVYTREYCSAIKRKEILTHDTIWTNLEDFMVSEKSQSQKDKYNMIILI